MHSFSVYREKARLADQLLGLQPASISDGDTRADGTSVRWFRLRVVRMLLESARPKGHDEMTISETKGSEDTELLRATRDVKRRGKSGHSESPARRERHR